MARLEVETGRHAGKSYELTKAVILGRGDNVAVQLPDGKASREHCRVFQQAGKWFVADLNSRNGICVNGAKTTRKELRNGDRIEVGETIVEFVTAETVAPFNEPGEIDVDIDEIDVDEIDIDVDDDPEPSAAPATDKRKGTSKKDSAFAKARADAAAARDRKSGSGSGGGGGGGGGGIHVRSDVLQFNKVDMNTASAFSLDLSQYSALTQMAIGGTAVGIFCGAVWGIFKLLGVTLS